MEPLELLLGIINRDPNLIGVVTKAAALASLNSLDDVELSDDLLAQVFNPDELLSELAALQISRMDKTRFEEVLERISAEQKNRLTKQVRDVEEGWENLIWDRIHVLMQNEYLKQLPSKLLYRIATEMELVHLMPEQSFDLVADDGTAISGLVKTGGVSLRVNDKNLVNLSENEFFGIPPLIVLEKNTIKIFSPAEASILIGEQEMIDEMMFDFEDLALAMYRWAGDQEKQWQSVTKEMVS